MRATTGKKIAIGLGTIATIAATVFLGFYLGDAVYMRFVFKGDTKDLGPGDFLGVLACGVLITAVILAFAILGWLRLYRKVGK